MNAICHRDYQSNGPIQFYQYDDRIEIMNHGGLYGRANVQNFPNVNDYRNIVLAEAMKVLGFVNRHSRGVLRVQKELMANENGEAIFDFGYQTAIVVREMKSPRGEQAIREAIAQGFLTEKGEKQTALVVSDGHENGHENGHKNGHENGHENEKGLEKPSEKPSKKPSEKPSEIKVSKFPAPIVEEVYKAIKLNRKAKYSWLQDNLGVSEATIKRAISDLKELGYISKEHSKVKGEWQLLK